MRCFCNRIFYLSAFLIRLIYPDSVKNDDHYYFTCQY